MDTRPGSGCGASCRVGAIVLAVAVAVLYPAPGRACFYDSKDFEGGVERQTSAEKLINGLYAPPEREVTRRENPKWLARLEGEKGARGADMGWLDEYGMALWRNGKLAEAHEVWKGQLAREPERFVTLCNRGTALDLEGDHAGGLALLRRAAGLRAGFRSGAEGLHVKMLEFQAHQRVEPTYGEKHLFVEELTPFWVGHPALPKTLRGETFPVPVSSDGVAELLRQFPQFGDGWVVLGMALEREGNDYLASLAYRRARKIGSGQRVALDRFLPGYEEYGAARDPARTAGRGMVYAALMVAGAAGGWWIWKRGRDAVEDVRDVRAEREAAARRSAAPKIGEKKRP